VGDDRPGEAPQRALQGSGLGIEWTAFESGGPAIPPVRTHSMQYSESL